jgi:pyroglutamyl-peptidase
MGTVLITGFGRFPGAPVNPSSTIALRLARRRRPCLAETRLIAHIFDTSYEAVDRELPSLITRLRPDAVLLFGLATRARHLRIEAMARNRVSALFPDVRGQRPEGRAIAPAATRAAMTSSSETTPAAYRSARRTTLPIARLVAAARAAGVAAAPSCNAGSYLCNYAYWRALEAGDYPGGPSVIFVHVPPVRFKKRLRQRPAPSGKWRPRKHLKRSRTGRVRHATPLSQLVRAGEAILLAVISAAATPHHEQTVKFSSLELPKPFQSPSTAP